jgi:GntR family transcriptional regulator
MMDATRFHVSEVSQVPMWCQLRNQMLSRVIRGEWSVGTQLPPETELAESLGVSRSTVRAAVEALVQDGLVVRMRGRGSFVTAAAATEVNLSPLGFYRTMTARGHVVRSCVLTAAVVDPTEELVNELNLLAGETILHIQRLRHVDGQPAVLSSNYLVHSLCRGIQDQDLTDVSLWELLEARLGRQVAGGFHSFRAVLATAEEQRLLAIGPQVPLLMSEGTNYLTDGTPLERSVVKVPGDRGLLKVRYVTRAALRGTDNLIEQTWIEGDDWRAGPDQQETGGGRLLG